MGGGACFAIRSHAEGRSREQRRSWACPTPAAEAPKRPPRLSQGQARWTVRPLLCYPRRRPGIVVVRRYPAFGLAWVSPFSGDQAFVGKRPASRSTDGLGTGDSHRSNGPSAALCRRCKGTSLLFVSRSLFSFSAAIPVPRPRGVPCKAFQGPGLEECETSRRASQFATSPRFPGTMGTTKLSRQSGRGARRWEREWTATRTGLGFDGPSR